MAYRQCIANHRLMGNQHGLVHCAYHPGKWQLSKKECLRCHMPLHFENLMEEDVLNIAVKETSPLRKESLI